MAKARKLLNVSDFFDAKQVFVVVKVCNYPKEYDVANCEVMKVVTESSSGSLRKVVFELRYHLDGYGFCSAMRSYNFMEEVVDDMYLGYREAAVKMKTSNQASFMNRLGKVKSLLQDDMEVVRKREKQVKELEDALAELDIIV